MTFISILIYGAAIWRLSHLLTAEEGPFNIFKWIRERAGIKHDEFGNVFSNPDTFFGNLLSCVYCSSMWVAIGWMVWYNFSPSAAYWTAIALSFSTVAILIDKLVNLK